MVGDEFVESVERPLEPRSGRGEAVPAEPGEKVDADGAPRPDAAVRPDEMPGGVALLRWQRRDESGRGGIIEREKRQTLSAVEAGDGTRREAADPSVAVVEQNRPSELARHDAILAGARRARVYGRLATEAAGGAPGVSPAASPAPVAT
jgi:hypothetical protein